MAKWFNKRREYVGVFRALYSYVSQSLLGSFTKSSRIAILELQLCTGDPLASSRNYVIRDVASLFVIL